MRAAEKSWLTGFIRTEYIDREEVWQTLEMFQ